ncbi:MAG: transposase DNA-binding-containing protein [Acidobacteriota bacterium]
MPAQEDEWIENEVMGCEFEDARHGKRLRELLMQLPGRVGAATPLACQADDSFGNRLRIDVVVPVRLSEWLHILRRHQPHLMSLLLQSPAKKMRSAAGFHSNQLHAKVRGEMQQLGTRQSLPRHYSAALVKPQPDE